ncbi:MAG: tripartite tricarboxylate transporter permease [Candidatus Thermoplasmatota archaeon]
MDVVTLAVLGAGAGAMTGLMPGVHVNTLCAVALAAAPASPGTAVGVAAAASAHLFTSLLPATYLGVPGEESGLGVLPAHRLTLRGRGPDAVRLGVRGTLAGLLVACVLLLPHKWLIAPPGDILPWIESHLAWILGGLLLLLVLREVPRGLRQVLAVLLVLALAGGLGLLSSQLSVQALAPGVAATALLPLLSGLFGAPALIESLRASRPVPEQQPARPGLRLHRPAVAGGIAAAAVTCLLPGLTSSVSLAATRWSEDRNGRAFLCAQAAIGGAHLVFSFGLLWVALRPRTGLAVAVATLWPAPAWSAGAAPAPVVPVLAACLLGAGLGAAAACSFDRAAASLLPRVGRQASAAALAFVTLLVAILSGWTGLLLYGVAALVGALPPRLGVARLHLTACLLVPVLALRLGLA